jgi:signal transduction histidine kinase
VIDLRTVLERYRRWDVTLRDLPLALLLLVAPLIPAMHGHGTALGELPTRPMDAPAGLVVALECLPLVVRRRWPAACLALVSLGFAIDQLSGYHTAAATALPIALVTTAAHLERHRSLAAVLVSAAYLPLTVALDRQGSSEGLAGFATFYLAMAIVWGIGVWLRMSRAVEAERRRRVAGATRAAERTRIARELHDVVTHHVTAMVVQAEAARYLTAAPERLDETLTAISDTGRHAISDLRHLLDLLNPEHTPEPRTPSVGELRVLVEQTRQAGQPVEFIEEGRPSESGRSAEIVTYRIVQESLTNALKHAHGSPTTVHVHHGEGQTAVQVITGGSGSRASLPGGGGRGLAGLQERVAALGGEFSAHRQVSGDFVVRASIPAGSPS